VALRAQTYLSMLCSLRWGLFFFFAGMCVLMTLTVIGFFPETKGLGIEETQGIFRTHWRADLPAALLVLLSALCMKGCCWCEHAVLLWMAARSLACR
jgi:hypothetical protein